MATNRPEYGIIEYKKIRDSFFALLRLYYMGFVGWGVSAGIAGQFSIALASNAAFSTFWGFAIATVSGLAILGMYLSRRYDRPWIEVSSISLLIGLMFSYMVSIGILAFESGIPSRYPSMWLPLIVSLIPGWRLYNIAQGGTLFKRHRKA